MLKNILIKDLIINLNIFSLRKMFWVLFLFPGECDFTTENRGFGKSNKYNLKALKTYLHKKLKLVVRKIKNKHWRKIVMNNILSFTKLVYQCFSNDDGEIIKEPTGKIKRLKLPQENLDFLYDYISFAMNSEMLNKISKIYVMSEVEGIDAIFNHYNRMHPEDKINLKTARSNLNYNRTKMIKVFDEDILEQVIYFPGKADLVKYRNQLDWANVRFSKSNIFSTKLMIDLPRDTGKVKPSEDSIIGFMEAIEVYRKAKKAMIEKTIVEEYEDVIKYFNYLSLVSHRSDEEEELYNTMMSFLNGNPIIML